MCDRLTEQSHDSIYIHYLRAPQSLNSRINLRTKLLTASTRSLDDW